jgi:putative acetyltransferase
MPTHDVRIEAVQEADTAAVTQMIRQNLEAFEEHGSVLASMSRRLLDLYGSYNQEGAKYFVARDMARGGQCIGGAGIGSFHGLPVSEGVAEIRDLVVEPDYRGQGLGNKLLNRCLDEAITNGYLRAYLETTPQMKHAQKLFMRTGFRPVSEESRKGTDVDDLPCYFVKEDIQSPTK